MLKQYKNMELCKKYFQEYNSYIGFINKSRKMCVTCFISRKEKKKKSSPTPVYKRVNSHITCQVSQYINISLYTKGKPFLEILKNCEKCIKPVLFKQTTANQTFQKMTNLLRKAIIYRKNFSLTSKFLYCNLFKKSTKVVHKSKINTIFYTHVLMAYILNIN